MIDRFYEPLDRYLQANKVLILYGPRRVGKTTLLQRFLAGAPRRYKFDSGDNIRTQQILGSLDFSRILGYAEGYDLLAIDEAQEIPNIGKALKILVDQIPGIQIIATGSSSFELAGQIGEPLTGRKRTLHLYPLAQSELLSRYNRHELRQQLDSFLIYGVYPEVQEATTRNAKIELVSEIAHSYLLKDILAFDQIKNANTLFDLLKLLAFQVGNEVSANELATQLGINVRTVMRYLDLLEKSFVLVRLGGFSKNLRKEVTRNSKYYFLDNGIRNALIAQFNPTDQRTDMGQLWENFVVIERIKRRTYEQIYANMYFWRTYDGQEVDLVEERDGELFGYECKWSSRRAAKPPEAWARTYQAQFSVITPDAYQDFLLLGNGQSPPPESANQ